MPLLRLEKSRALLAMVPVMAMLLLGSACSRVTNTQGYIVDEELVAAVAPGIDNKESVTKTLGRPTIVSEWDDNSWYYVSRTTKQFAYLRPRPTEGSLLVIHFTPEGTVREVEQRGLEQIANIEPSSDKTRTLGRETGILQDLFGNIGQVGTGAPAGGP